MDKTQQEQLRLLAIFHYGVGGLAALFSLFPLIHLSMGLMFVMSPEGTFQSHDPDAPPPEFFQLFGWFFVVMASVFILGGLTFSALVIYAGRCLQRRAKYMFCFVMACVECIFIPFGTVLGIFTILLLNRPEVRADFPQTA